MANRILIFVLWNAAPRLNWISNILDEQLAGRRYQAFIFGSQAKQVALKKADIDVGIIADLPIPNIKFARILNAIEQLPMLYKIDLVDFNHVDDNFKAVALKNTELL